MTLKPGILRITKISNPEEAIPSEESEQSYHMMFALFKTTVITSGAERWDFSGASELTPPTPTPVYGFRVAQSCVLCSVL
jgi:hypothetical protein